MAIFARHSDKEYEALAKKLAAAEAKLSELSAEKEAISGKASSLEKASAEQKEENGLLLAQLHQVQEALEKYFLENKAYQEKIATKDKELKSEKNKLAAKDNELASQKEALAEANKLIKAEGDAKVNEIQKQKANLEKKLSDALASSAEQKTELEQKLAAAREAANRAKSDFGVKEAVEADLKSENDLLLAQLHQVQEELEKYYLGNKELESSVTEAAELVKQLRYAMVRTLVEKKKVISFMPAKTKRPSKPKKAA